VKPFVKSNKNDFLDAEAIAEAVDRQNMRFAPIKTDDQLDLQAMPEILENANTNLMPRMRNLVSLLWSEWKDLEQQIVAMNEEVEQIACSDPACQ